MSDLIAGFIPRTGALDASKSGMYNTAIIVMGLLCLIGLGAGVHSIYVGHEHTFGVSREVPWGILIAMYVFFVVTSTGLCIVSCLGHVFGFVNFLPIAKRAVFLSIITILAGFIVIAFEIENSWRMPVGQVLGANISSNIWWMGTLYGAYLLFMILEFIMLQRGIHKYSIILGFSALITGIAAHSNLGAVFGLLNGREYWHGPYMPIYFIVSAALSGCVAIIFFTCMAYKINGWQMSKLTNHSIHSVSRVATLFLASIMFFTIWKVITGITGNAPGKYEAMQMLLTGDYAINFWGGEVMLGLILPFIIIIGKRGKSMNALFIAATSGMIGIFFMRYDLVIVGQLVPHYHGMGLIGYPEHFTYSPTLHENLVVMGGLAFCGFMFLLGEKLFHGHLTETHFT